MCHLSQRVKNFIYTTNSLLSQNMRERSVDSLQCQWQCNTNTPLPVNDSDVLVRKGVLIVTDRRRVRVSIRTFNTSICRSSAAPPHSWTKLISKRFSERLQKVELHPPEGWRAPRLRRLLDSPLLLVDIEQISCIFYNRNYIFSLAFLTEPLINGASQLMFST